MSFGLRITLPFLFFSTLWITDIGWAKTVDSSWRLPLLPKQRFTFEPSPRRVTFGLSAGRLVVAPFFGRVSGIGKDKTDCSSRAGKVLVLRSSAGQVVRIFGVSGLQVSPGDALVRGAVLGLTSARGGGCRTGVEVRTSSASLDLSSWKIGRALLQGKTYVVSPQIRFPVKDSKLEKSVRRYLLERYVYQDEMELLSGSQIRFGSSDGWIYWLEGQAEWFLKANSSRFEQVIRTFRPKISEAQVLAILKVTLARIAARRQKVDLSKLPFARHSMETMDYAERVLAAHQLIW